MKRSPMRRVSAKRAATFIARRACIEAVIARDGVCQYPVRTAAWLKLYGVPLAAQVLDACDGPLTAHEPAKRSHGADPTDPSQALALCQRHHAAVHANPAIAEVLGLLYRNGRRVEASL